MNLRRDVWAGLVLALVVLGGLFFALAMLAAASQGVSPITEDCVAVVDIRGGIYEPSHTIELIRRYAENDRVKALVLRLDTPGGGVAASQEVYEAVMDARGSGKPIIASMGSVAASGGYYIAAACDTIMALPATVTGSIGVIGLFPNAAELMDMIGVEYDIIKTGEFKDTGTPSRQLTDEERAYLAGLMDDLFAQFLDVVAEHRPLSRDQVEALADGRLFTGRQAKENGLIDLLGTEQDALDLAGELAELGEDPPVHRESRRDVLSEVFGGIAGVIAGGYESGLPMMSYLMHP